MYINLSIFITAVSAAIKFTRYTEVNLDLGKLEQIGIFSWDEEELTPEKDLLTNPYLSTEDKELYKIIQEIKSNDTFKLISEDPENIVPETYIPILF